jgi:hypothetical protein
MGAACVKGGAFQCSANAECNDPGAQCVAGFCAFEDSTCPSLLRYGAYSGSVFSGECVPVPDPPDAAPTTLTVDAAPLCPDPNQTPCDLFTGCPCLDQAKICIVDPSLPGAPLSCAPPEDNWCEGSPCAPGTTCAYYGDAFHCLIVCDAAHPCPGGQQCAGQLTLPPSTTPVAELCLFNCALLWAQDCPFGLGCYLAVSDPHPVPTPGGRCLTSQGLADGQQCFYMNDCAPGSVCVSGSPPICRRFCNLAAPNCGAQTCRPFSGSVGYCGP